MYYFLHSNGNDLHSFPMVRFLFIKDEKWNLIIKRRIIVCGRKNKNWAYFMVFSYFKEISSDTKYLCPVLHRSDNRSNLMLMLPRQWQIHVKYDFNQCHSDNVVVISNFGRISIRVVDFECVKG